MYQPAALLLCVGGFFLMFVVGILNAIPHVGAVLGRAITIWFQFTFARAFGVIYLLPRAQRVARRLSGKGPASVEEEPEPTPENEATPGNEATPEAGSAPAP